MKKTILVPGIVWLLLTCTTAWGQINLIYHEGFNDDGDGTRYTMSGRGSETFPNGPALWDHNFNVDVIGLPALAAEKRAAILWSSVAIEDDFTEDSLAIWDNLIDYMLDGKEGANIGFFPNNTSGTADFLTFRVEDKGHTAFGLDAIPDPSEVDLIIQSEEGNPDPGGLFASYDNTGYPVPVITYAAGNHDDTLVSSIGAATSGGPTQVTLSEAHKDHPVLGGRTGVIPWVDEFLAEQPLQGIGVSTPAGSSILATFEDNGTTLPALLIVEQGDPLLGAFNPLPEGDGFIVGGDMNEAFPADDPIYTTADTPRVVQLNPVDISGESGVKLSVGLAATDVDFESPDFLRVSYGETADGEFTTLAQFDGMAPGVLIHPELGALNPNEFTDFTFEIPDDVNNLIVRFEAFSTWPNEVLGIDNVRIFTGEPLPPCDPNTGGDLDGNGAVEFADFLVLSANFSQAVEDHSAGDIDCNGTVEFADFLVMSNNFGNQGQASSVPEPSGALLLGFGVLCLMGSRRRSR